MEDLAQYQLYGSSLVLGAMTALMALKHRGDDEFDTERGVSVAKGNGISSKIIKKCPSYSKVSPTIDHVLAGVSLPAATAGGLGLLQTPIFAMDNKPVSEFALMLPFYMGCVGYWAMEGIWETKTYFARNKKLSESDIGQIAADVSVPAMFLYAADCITKMM